MSFDEGGREEEKILDTGNPGSEMQALANEWNAFKASLDSLTTPAQAIVKFQEMIKMIQKYPSIIEAWDALASVTDKEKSDQYEKYKKAKSQVTELEYIAVSSELWKKRESRQVSLQSLNDFDSKNTAEKAVIIASVALATKWLYEKLSNMSSFFNNPKLKNNQDYSEFKRMFALLTTPEKDKLGLSELIPLVPSEYQSAFTTIAKWIEIAWVVKDMQAESKEILKTQAKDLLVEGAKKYLNIKLDEKKTIGQTTSFGIEFVSVNTDASKTVLAQDPWSIASEITNNQLLQTVLSIALSQVLFNEEYTRNNVQTYVTKDYKQNIWTVKRGNKSIQLASWFTTTTWALSPQWWLSNPWNVASIIPGGSEVFTAIDMVKGGKERGGDELKSFSIYTGVSYKQILWEKTALEITWKTLASVDASLYLWKEYLEWSNIFDVLPSNVVDLAQPYFEDIATGKLSFALASPLQYGGEGKIALHFFPTDKIDTWIGAQGRFLNGKVYDTKAFWVNAGVKINLWWKKK